MPIIDEIGQDLKWLENAIMELKVQYEQFFMGVVKREPYKLRLDAERMIREYAQQPPQNTGHKFKYNTITAKFNSYRSYWDKTLKQINDGTYVRRKGGFGTGTPQKPTVGTPPQKSPAGGGGGGDDPYEAFIKARQSTNEPTAGLTREAFQKSISAQQQKMAQKYGTTNLETKVFVKDGKTMVSVKPKG